MKRIIKMIIFLAIIVLLFIYHTDIISLILDNMIYKYTKSELTYNEYYRDYDYEFVKPTKNFKVKSKQEMINVIYSAVNSGEDRFTFYCDIKYKECKSDAEAIAHDDKLLSNLNNFINPYNTFKTISLNITGFNATTIEIKHLYTKEEIEYVNNFIKDFISKNVNDGMTDYDKIKVFHDYIINNTVYDSYAAELVNTDASTSNTAYLLLTTKKAICSGYSDIMAIYLDHLGIANYRVSSKNHIWNLVKLNDKWLHLDLTWDDPISSQGNVLLYDYFLINTEQLLKLDSTEHKFDTSIFIEAK